MVYKVLIVDDSHFFQERIKDIINQHPQLKVVGIASNGRDAVEMDEALQPDIISMDYEMPLMDGISAVKAILAKRAVPIVMFSSLTYEGAKITLDALAAGAVDFIPKSFADVSRNSENLKQKIHTTLFNFARQAKPKYASTAQPEGLLPKIPAVLTQPTVLKSSPALDVHAHTTAIVHTLKTRPKLLVIGASTGGPVALTEVLHALPAHFPVPIIVVQHMPETFTRAFAERLNKLCDLSISEAEEGVMLVPGGVYIAPGGKQLLIDKRGCIKILPGDERMNYKPSLDITFASAANAFGAGVLGIVLTGMGADGRDGARLIKEQQGVMWAQDEASCVVYGMPKAVFKAGLCDHVLPLNQIAEKLKREC